MKRNWTDKTLITNAEQKSKLADVVEKWNIAV
jgi:hypothetical protein